LAALAGGLARLPKVIGKHNAMGIILTARRVSAEEGVRLGFVNEVVPHDVKKILIFNFFFFSKKYFQFLIFLIFSL